MENVDGNAGACAEPQDADLAGLRGEIDGIDDRMADLFVRRMELAGEVAACKRRTGRALRDPAREREIVSRVTGRAPAWMETPLRLLFGSLFETSRALQRASVCRAGAVSQAIAAARARAHGQFPARATVACQGAEGSYSQQAAVKMFPVATIMFFNTFDDVFSAVEKGMCPYGVLPIENSSAGSVAAVYDLMVRHRFSIVRAARQKIDHVLLGAPGAALEGIREVSSHPHALAQCGAFLSAHPGWTVSPASNTAAAARALAASGRRDLAVLASRECAELYGLDVLAGGVADAASYTRFICISKEAEIRPEARKMCIMMTLPHRPGALYSVMAKFAAIDVNLTKLESRPIPGMDFEFRFTFEFEADADDPRVAALLDEFATDPQVERFSFLGAYAEV